MTRRLEGKTFHIGDNNGVVGLIEEEVLEQRTFKGHLISQLEDRVGLAYRPKVRIAVDDALPPDGPIFTFTNSDRNERSSWYTGDRKLLEKLLIYVKSEGAKIKQGGGYIPFSNGYEICLAGVDLMRSELRFITTKRQFIETFGISPEDLASQE